MFDYVLNIQDVNVIGIDSDIRTQFGSRVSGVSYSNETLRVHFYDELTASDEADVQAIIDAHDPVFITVEREGDNVTVTIRKPYNVDAATELTLAIDGVSMPSALALVSNVATTTLISEDIITISLVDNYPCREVSI